MSKGSLGSSKATASSGNDVYALQRTGAPRSATAEAAVRAVAHAGPRSVVVAALYEHSVGRELRMFFEGREDDILHTQLGTLPALEGKAAQLRSVLLEQGWLPVSHQEPPVC